MSELVDIEKTVFKVTDTVDPSVMTVERGNGVSFIIGKKENGKFMPYPVNEDEDKKELLAAAVKNLINSNPCIPKSLSEFDEYKSDDILSTCYTVSSTSVYYGAEQLNELSEQLNDELYILQFDSDTTLICPVSQFEPEEMEAAFNGLENCLTDEIMVFDRTSKLQNMSEWQENHRLQHNQGR